MPPKQTRAHETSKQRKKALESTRNDEPGASSGRRHRSSKKPTQGDPSASTAFVAGVSSASRSNTGHHQEQSLYQHHDDSSTSQLAVTAAQLSIQPAYQHPQELQGSQSFYQNQNSSNTSQLDMHAGMGSSQTFPQHPHQSQHFQSYEPRGHEPHMGMGMGMDNFSSAPQYRVDGSLSEGHRVHNNQGNLSGYKPPPQHFDSSAYSHEQEHHQSTDRSHGFGSSQIDTIGHGHGSSAHTQASGFDYDALPQLELIPGSEYSKLAKEQVEEQYGTDYQGGEFGVLALDHIANLGEPSRDPYAGRFHRGEAHQLNEDHWLGKPPPPVLQADGTFKCPSCETKFSSPNNCQRHWEKSCVKNEGLQAYKFEKLLQEAQARAAEPRPAGKPHQCPYCFLSFVDSSGLGLHEKACLIHPLPAPSAEKPYHCPKCLTRFKMKTKFDYHVLSCKAQPGAEGVKFQCPHCLHSYLRKASLAVHLKACKVLHSRAG